MFVRMLLLCSEVLDASESVTETPVIETSKAHNVARVSFMLMCVLCMQDQVEAEWPGVEQITWLIG